MKARTAHCKHQRRARGRGGGDGTLGCQNGPVFRLGATKIESPTTLLLLNSKGRLVWNFVINGGSKVARHAASQHLPWSDRHVYASARQHAPKRFFDLGVPGNRALMTRVLVRCRDQKVLRTRKPVMIFNRAERSRLHGATQTC